MKWWGYLIFVLVSLILAPLSALCTFFNPFSLLFLHLAAPAVRLLGHTPSVDGWSSIGPAMIFNVIWPLTLPLLHWLNFRALRWNAWAYAGLFLVLNVIIAFIVLLLSN